MSTQYISEASVSRNNKKKKGNIRITNSLRKSRCGYYENSIALHVAGASEATQPFSTLPNDADAEP